MSRPWLTGEFQALDDSDLRMTQQQGVPSESPPVAESAGPEPRRERPTLRSRLVPTLYLKRVVTTGIAADVGHRRRGDDGVLCE